MSIFEIVVSCILVLLTITTALLVLGVIFIIYRSNKAYKLLKEDRVVNVTIVPSLDGEVDIFDR